MAGSVNKVIIVGNLGQDPEIKTFPSGGRLCNLSIATSESWKDRQTGEKKERTQWHRVVLTSDGLIKIAEQYLHKGDKVFIEGMLETRSWEQDGQKKFATEVVVKPYRGTLTILSSRRDDRGSSYQSADQYAPQQTQHASQPVDQGYSYESYEDDEIPF